VKGADLPPRLVRESARAAGGNLRHELIERLFTVSRHGGCLAGQARVVIVPQQH